jgi:hypothetical protein
MNHQKNRWARVIGSAEQPENAQKTKWQPQAPGCPTESPGACTVRRAPSQIRRTSHGRGIGDSREKYHSRVVRKTGMVRDGGARQATPLPGAVRQNFEILARPVAQGEPGNVARGGNFVFFGLRLLSLYSFNTN